MALVGQGMVLHSPGIQLLLQLCLSDIWMLVGGREIQRVLWTTWPPISYVDSHFDAIKQPGDPGLVRVVSKLPLELRVS